MRSILFILMLLSASAEADQLSVRTGLWETTLTTTNTLMPDPVTNVSETCIESDEYEPELMLDGVEQCDMQSSTVSGNKLAFAMDCNMQGAEAKVAGTYVSHGDTGEGDMTVDMQMGPIVMSLTLEWDARYLGEC